MESVPQAEICQRSQTARVLFGNPANFTRIREMSEFQHYYERPLLVEAWAQTTTEDIDLVGNVHRQRNLELQKELSVLREKVRVLEDDLRVHVQILNQIHATAAIKTVIPRAETEYMTPTPTPPVTPVMQQQYVQCQQIPRRISPNTTSTSRSAATTHTFGPQVINATQMKTENPNTVLPMDSIKYTIVGGEESGNNNCEPIEIHLAEEDGAINLNSSADSGRLEICLSTDEQTEQQNHIETEPRAVKEEQFSTNSPPPPPLPAQSGILVKRRKLNAADEGSQVQETQYYYNGYSSESSPTATVILQSVSTGKSTATATTSKSSKSRPPSRHSSERVNSNQPITMLEQDISNTVRQHNDDNVMVSIGPNNTRVPYKLYESINWESPSIATRKLLMAVFDRETLATHSMTGKPSPAFKGQCKPQKKRLDPSVTEDILFVVTRRCKVSDKEVRNAITTKCADENKMMKLQLKKNRSLRESNKENVTT